MNNSESSKISSKIIESASIILAEIKKANNVLLHCHPSPDPDSVGSALAMKFTLEQLGKKVTVIKGDSIMPQAFMHFPGATDIVMKNFFEIDLSQFDTFIVQDCSTLDRISSIKPIVLPDSLNVINIDHHNTNVNFAPINLVESSYPATAQILYDLFSEWGIEITPEIAANLFIGIYTDTGGLKYRGATVRTFEIAASLVSVFPDFSELISRMENSNSPEVIVYQGIALSSVKTFLGGRLAISAVSLDDLKSKNINVEDVGTSMISPILRTVVGWDIDVALLEEEPNVVKISLRTRDVNKYDVSRLAVALGGGGHKAAAGASLKMSIDESVKMVVAKAKELYNL